MTHTPGPWKQGAGDRANRMLVFSKRSRVASCSSPENARLIAAAPTMLAALSELLATLRKVQKIIISTTLSTTDASRSNQTVQSIRAIIRAAIARAEGRDA